MAEQRRELQFLVPDSIGAHLLLTDEGALPLRIAALGEGETTVQGAIRTMRDQLDLHVPLLEIHFDYAFAHDDQGDDAIPVLVVAEPPAPDWVPPADLVWRAIGEPDPAVAPGLQPRLAELLGERRGRLPLASLRPRWARTGWHARATGWIFQRLDALGRPPTGPIEQVRHWGISALMRAPTEQGQVWFKAVFPLFAQEVAITALLDREQPGSVAPVLAHDDPQGWLLMDDFGSTTVADHADADAVAIQAMVAIQRSFVGSTDALSAVGVPGRPFGALADLVAVALLDEELAPWIGLDRARVETIVGAVRDAANVIGVMGFPPTLTHGDFHPENVALVDGRPVIFDWSDAAIAHPIVDAMTWTSWLQTEEPERAERAWHAFLEAWSDVCPPDRADAVRPALRIAAAAYHSVSYHAIVSHMEPLRRPELADGLAQYVTHLDAAVPPG